MNILWSRDKGILRYNDKVINVVCRVRNELNGARRLTEEPVYTELKDGSKGVVYMPRPFPKGKWNVLTILSKDDPYMAPEFISTDAYQMVDEWTMEDNHYGHKTGRQVLDYGYGLHCSTSSTTLGCGKIVLQLQREELTKVIKECLAKNEEVKLTVE